MSDRLYGDIEDIRACFSDLNRTLDDAEEVDRFVLQRLVWVETQRLLEKAEHPLMKVDGLAVQVQRDGRPVLSGSTPVASDYDMEWPDHTDLIYDGRLPWEYDFVLIAGTTTSASKRHRWDATSGPTPIDTLCGTRLLHHRTSLLEPSVVQHVDHYYEASRKPWVILFGDEHEIPALYDPCKRCEHRARVMLEEIT